MDGDAITQVFDTFDEDGYLRLYPDVAEAIARQDEPSAWHHYRHHGKREGRRANDFDEDFYLRAYPIVATEIAEGLAASPLEHYARLGRGRGFLPSQQGKRPAVPAWSAGGLWLDQPHAADLIAGRVALGRLKHPDATLLHRFAEDGYVVLKGAVPARELAAAKADLDRAFSGGFPTLRFGCATLGGGAQNWHPDLANLDAEALDIHHVSSVLRGLLFTPALASVLALLFEAPTIAVGSTGLARAGAAPLQQDTAHAAFTLPRQFVSAWIALDDSGPESGELFGYAGSHRLPDFFYGGYHRSITEARRFSVPEERLEGEARQHSAQLEGEVAFLDLGRRSFVLDAGDVLIRHAALAHGAMAGTGLRRGVAAHFCPDYVMPVYAEQSPSPMFEQDGHLFMSAHYAGPPPIPRGRRTRVAEA